MGRAIFGLLVGLVCTINLIFVLLILIKAA